MIKQIELELKKRLLIVDEPTMYERINDHEFQQYWSGKEFKLICKGSELTEDIAKYLVDFHSHGTAFKNYKGLWVDRCSTALESFISAIEAANYYWEKNPIEKPKEEDFTYQFDVVNGAETFDGDSYDVELRIFEKYESRTFNPEQTLIFEILL